MQLNEPATVNVFPNPASSNATLIINGKTAPVNIIISDLNGKVVWKKNNIEEKQIDLPVQNFSAGLYFVFIKLKVLIQLSN
jgi:hypothetical protein